MRFGQFVANVVRSSHDWSGRERDLEEVEEISDEEFLAALDEWNQRVREHRDERERRRRQGLEEPRDPKLLRGVRQTQAM